MSKAYKISCVDDDHHQIVTFAENRNSARSGDTRDCCDCDFVDIRIVRAPSFDELSPGPVTVQQYLDRGWFWDCTNCTRQIYNDSDPIIIGDSVFCNRDCILSARKSHDPEGAHESIVSFCNELDEWINGSKEEK